eukprot:5017486-Pleurochrysis_carterae.AAC.4
MPVQSFTLSDFGAAELAITNLCTSRLQVRDRNFEPSVIALDNNTYSQCRNARVPVSVRLFSSSSEYKSVFKVEARMLQWLKIAILYEKTDSFNGATLLSDADIIWLGNPLPELRAECLRGTDIAMMHNGDSGYALLGNAGFILSCGTLRARNFWRRAATTMGITAATLQSDSALRQAVKRFQYRLIRFKLSGMIHRQTPLVNDQHLLNLLVIQDVDLNFQLLKPEIFANGCTVNSLGVHMKRQIKVYHACCEESVDEKIRQFERAINASKVQRRLRFRRCINRLYFRAT